MRARPGVRRQHRDGDQTNPARPSRLGRVSKRRRGPIDERRGQGDGNAERDAANDGLEPFANTGAARCASALRAPIRTPSHACAAE